MGTKLVPNVSVDKFTNFAKSKEVIIAAAAFIGTPIAINQASKVLLEMPFFQEHLTAGLILFGFLLFAVSLMLTGIPRTILAAVGAGVFVSAIMSIGQVQEALGKVGAGN